LLKPRHLAVFGAKNELVFECKRTQFEPPKASKDHFLRGIEVKIRESEGAAGGQAQGGYMSFEFDLSGQWKSAQLRASLTVEMNCRDSSSAKTVSSE
jgi:hypothetical protein